MTHVRALEVAAFFACVLPVSFPAGPAWGAYPEKPVRLIVPSPPGGGNDILARLAGQKLTPAAIVSEVNGKLAHAFTQRDVTDRIAALGAEPAGGGPKRLTEHLNSEIPKWRE